MDEDVTGAERESDGAGGNASEGVPSSPRRDSGQSSPRHDREKLSPQHDREKPSSPRSDRESPSPKRDREEPQPAPTDEEPEPARPDISITAEGGALMLDDVDLSAAQVVLARLGADGSDALDRLSTSSTIELLAGLNGLSSAIAAVQARALLRLEAATKDDCLARGEAARTALRTARAEAAFALHEAPAAAGQSMSSSRRLVHSMHGMLSALAHGKVTPAAAHRVGRVMGPASPSLRTQVDEVLTAHLPYLEGCGVQEWGSEAEKVMQTLDPEGTAARHVRATNGRGVTVRRSENGMCRVTATLTALDGGRIRKGLSLAAEKARADGDRRGHSQIMADLFADTLIGRGDGAAPTTMDIGVIITDRSLLAPAHADPAVIEGIGPVPYEHIRDEMRRAVKDGNDDPDLLLALRNLYIDPEDGQLVAVQSRSRSFPPALSRFLRWSHLTCRAPYCDAPIRQNDHVTPHADGGATSVDNGNGLCALDNQKEDAGMRARVVRDADGIRRSVEWTTRYGQTARRRGMNFDPVGTAWRALRGRPSLEDPRDTETATGRAEEGVTTGSGATGAGASDAATASSAATGDTTESTSATGADPDTGTADAAAEVRSTSDRWQEWTIGELGRRSEHAAPPATSHATMHRAVHRIAPFGIVTPMSNGRCGGGFRGLHTRSDYVLDVSSALDSGPSDG